MKMNYLAPLTEIVYISAQKILEGDGTTDSDGFQDPGGVDANIGSFDVSEEITSGKGIWDD
jgi:hypothetical protein